MVVSAAKLEANRRNAQKSCGPRTEEGKNRSKLNAVKHGLRAATLVLLDEDAQALEDRRAEWAAGPLTTYLRDSFSLIDSPIVISCTQKVRRGVE
jgi:hypothetical protein